eukprot:11506925-Alexandrium_andersonii.AAC.1
MPSAEELCDQFHIYNRTSAELGLPTKPKRHMWAHMAMGCDGCPNILSVLSGGPLQAWDSFRGDSRCPK